MIQEPVSELSVLDVTLPRYVGEMLQLMNNAAEAASVAPCPKSHLGELLSRVYPGVELTPEQISVKLAGGDNAPVFRDAAAAIANLRQQTSLPLLRLQELYAAVASLHKNLHADRVPLVSRDEVRHMTTLLAGLRIDLDKQIAERVS